ACYFTCNSESQIGELVEAVRHLLFCGVFHGPMNIIHRNRVLIMLGRYPWDEMKGQTPMSESVAARLAKEKNIGAWNGIGAICGAKEQVLAAKQTIKRCLAGKVDRLNFVSDRKLRLLGTYPGIFSRLLGIDIAQLLKTLRASFG